MFDTIQARVVDNTSYYVDVIISCVDTHTSNKVNSTVTLTITYAQKTGSIFYNLKAGSLQVLIDGDVMLTFSWNDTLFNVSGMKQTYTGSFSLSGSATNRVCVVSTTHSHLSKLNKTCTYYQTHTYNQAGSVRTDATCTAAATYWYKCACGLQGTTYFSSGNALGHDNTAAGAKRSDATCTAAATYWYKCSRCGTQSTSYYNSGSALGHSWPNDFAYTDSNGISKGARYKNCTRCKTRLHTQYGVWANAGTGISATTGTNWYDSGASVTVGATVKTGYTWGAWTGWSTKNPWTFTGLNQAFSFTANATPNRYTIAYNGNGASGGATNSSSHTYDAPQVLISNGYTKPGYKFIGWATSPSGGVVYTDAQSVVNLTATNGATINLYAVWELSANCQIGVGGQLKPAVIYVGKNGAWRNTVVKVGKNGVWKDAGM